MLARVKSVVSLFGMKGVMERSLIISLSKESISIVLLFSFAHFSQLLLYTENMFYQMRILVEERDDSIGVSIRTSVFSAVQKLRMIYVYVYVMKAILNRCASNEYRHLAIIHLH